MSPLRVVIVGAGIGGPAVALALAQNGHNVSIFEQSKGQSGVGYAFRITPNSDRCLKYLGIDVVAGGAVSAHRNRMLNSKGQVIREVRENADLDKAKKGVSVFISRGQLHQRLMDAALESGVQFRQGMRVHSVDASNTTVILEDGETITADLIIAADGLHSVVRSAVVDTSKHFPTASTGHNAFRFMIPRSAIQDDATLATLVSDDFKMFSWFGNGKAILVYPVDFDTQFNVTCTHPESESDKKQSKDTSASIAYNQKASLETVLDIYREFDPVAVRLFEVADPDGFRIWKLQDMDEIPTWSNNHTVLLGDACHPVQPFSVSGASMAIEDALTLSVLIPKDLHPTQIPDRLKLYEEIRRPRVARVREAGRNGGRANPDREAMMAYMKFLSEHDAVEHAKEALMKHTMVST